MNLNLESYNPERVKYVVWSFEKGNEINIDGQDLVYAQLGETHHGLQCNYCGDNPKHRLITRKLKKIAELFKEIESLNEI